MSNLESVFEVPCDWSIVGTFVMALGEVITDPSDVGSTEDFPDGDNENR